MRNREKETKVFEGEFLNKKIFSIYKINKKQEFGKYPPVISFGINKARLILKHIDEIKLWIEKIDACEDD